MRDHASALRWVQHVLWLTLGWSASVATSQALSMASRPNHLMGSRFLRFHVADIPPEYSYLRAFHDPYRFPDAPLDHLGPLQHPESVQYSTYNSDYNRGVRCKCEVARGSFGALQDRAFWHALTSSPLRVANPDHADFVYVPVFWLLLNESFMQPFMDNAFTHLPLLGKKPHVVVLARPRHEHTKNNDPVVRCMVSVGDICPLLPPCTTKQTNHENAKHFIFLTPVVPNIFTPGVVRFGPHIQYPRAPLRCILQMSLPNYVTYPYFHVVHWSLYTMLQKHAFDLGAVAASKDTLIMQSYVVRPVRVGCCTGVGALTAAWFRLSMRACLRQTSFRGTCSTCSAGKPMTATATTLTGTLPFNHTWTDCSSAWGTLTAID